MRTPVFTNILTKVSMCKITFKKMKHASLNCNNKSEVKSSFSYKKTLSLVIILLIGQLSSAQTGTWTALKNKAPNPNQGVMLLLTDGTVICANTAGSGYGTGWDKLTPDIHGSYANGTWTSIASMNYDRTAFSSQVLPSGKVYVAGGEYGAGGSYGEVYDPVANTWTVCGNIPSGWNIYDAPSELLYNGNVLEGPEIGANGSQPCNSILQWNPTTLNYINESAEPENHDEASWIKLPDSTVLASGMPYPKNPSQDSSCRYVPQTNTWMIDAMIPGNLFDAFGFESGCAILLPNKKAIFFGATYHNAIYTPSGKHTTKGTWAAAANFPKIGGNYVGQPDAPGAMMVNGHILLAVSQVPDAGNTFYSPTYFLEYDYVTNAFTQITANIPSPIGANNLSTAISQNTSFLDLPDGTVLMGYSANDGSNPDPTQYYIYTPGSAPIAQGKPTITAVTTSDCTNYMITGKLFNGISEGTGYGDDLQNSTNYPLIRITNGTNVYYAKTTNWNRVGAIATDSLEDTAYFTFPVLPPNGTYSLVVVANGFASNPTKFTLPCSLTGIQQVVENNYIKVYPNPSNGLFTFQSSQPVDKSIISIYNILGEEIVNKEVSGPINQIDLSGRSQGVYFYRVISVEGNMLSTGKLLVK